MGQRARFPVQALGYVKSTKVILGLPEAAGVYFLLRVMPFFKWSPNLGPVYKQVG